jgi:hypothetical protein
MANEIPDIPPDMRKIYLRLRRWWGTHARRVPLPDALWPAAGGLAREHGINRTAEARLVRTVEDGDPDRTRAPQEGRWASPHQPGRGSDRSWH